MAFKSGCSTFVVVLSAISLAFLIIATITAPATSLSLAEAEGLRYGVFGYCYTANDTCVTGDPSYSVSDLTQLTDWTMDDNARDTLVKILIVTPVAAGLTLISLIFNALGHFRVFGSSTVFYAIAFVFALLAFFAAAITVIVTLLLFYPHVMWPSWILIGSGVLNLVSVPLVFFAMRAGPHSTDDDDEHDVDLDDYDGNITDLTDGDNFKNNSSFKMNDFSSISKNDNYSTEKFSGPSAIKVVTDDSSFSGSNQEKVSMHDYSKPIDMESQNYRSYSYGTATGAATAAAVAASAGTTGNTTTSTAAQPQSHRANAGFPPAPENNNVLEEGAPNLVSSTNYNRGGAVRSEAPKFQSQSARPEYSITTANSSAEIYPSAQYGVSESNASQQQVSNESSAPYPLSTLDQTDSSNLNSLREDDYNEINDDGSDFTSVSQRAANPRYYRGMQSNGPSLFQNQQQLQDGAQIAGDYQQNYQPYSKGQAQHGPSQYGPSQYGPSQHGPSQYGPSQHVPSQYGPSQYVPSQYGPAQSGPSTQYVPQQQFSGVPQQQQPQQPQQPPQVDASDYLLSHNPDFQVGGSAYPKQSAKKSMGIPSSSGGYRPAYKRLQNSSKGLPAASLSNDSPYNIR